MIHFKEIKFSNFLSVGDQPTIIQLDKTITTVVTGKNGAGKSTFIDALVYALFGKPFRKVRLGQLINNVNEGSLEVEISFSAGSKDYIVKRGMKPAVFEIYSNGEMIPQPAITADYQHILENDILKLNYKSFTQIIILGSASFVPFMQLKLGDRREIIENLLDISVFTEMNKILKSKIKELKEDITDTEHKLDLTKQKHKSNREFFTEATDVRQKMFKTFDGQINDAQANMRFRDMDMLGCKEHIDEIENSMLSCEGYGDKLLIVMAKIDIITLTGLTATDGSEIASGATIKFSSEFQIGSLKVMVRPKTYRNRELFEAGYSPINTDEIPDEFQILFEEAEFYVLTPQQLYTEVCDYLNNLFGEEAFEVVIIP